ncbi:MAG: hypothetical protein JSV84_10415 [Gemmatimonadota bacterium]|nr:MAG: hypothetical protein JSV84_10415 [Gemmatimonadota bacterium]
MRGKNFIRFRALILVAVCSGVWGCPQSVKAQWKVGADLVVAIPMAEFTEVTDTGTGLELKGHYGLRNLPNVSLGADAIFITYQYEPYFEPGFMVETRTQSIRFTLGPQLSAYYRRTELYLSAKYGLYYFYTHDDIFDGFGIWLTRTRNSNTEFGWNVTSGLVVGIARMPKKNFDLAVHVGGSWHVVRDGFKTVIETEGDPIDVRRDIEEFCIHAGLVFLFR